MLFDMFHDDNWAGAAERLKAFRMLLTASSKAREDVYCNYRSKDR